VASSRLVLVPGIPQARLSDAELVEAVAGGDTAAVGLIWDRYSALVRQVLKASFGPDASVEDLLQDVFMVLVGSAAKLRDPSALRSFLVGIAVRKVAFERRKRWVRRWVMLSATGNIPEVEQSPRDMEGVEALRALYRLLERLPERRRMAFVLRHVEGLGMLEVAAALQVSESTAKREVNRARDQVLSRARREPALRAYLGEPEDVDGGAHG
jgi:RNA polymerase sigma-70 factor (ECF subfamily)